MTSKPQNILTSQTPDYDWYRKRLMVTVWFIIPVFAVLLLRLFYLQIIEGDTFRKLSENNCIRLQTIDPPRGLIFDKNGILLVDNRPSYDLGLVVRDASPLDITVQNLSSILMLPENEIMELIHAKNHKHHSPYNATLIQANIGRNTLAYLESNRYSLPGIVVDVRLRRQYVYPRLASHVLGYIGEINSGELKGEAFSGYRPGDVVGKIGVERSFEVILKGQRGGRQIEVNSSGRLVNVLSTVTSVPGQNIYLSIDKSLQEKAETLLSDATGALVAMNPNTGHILALASSPTFDQNAFIDGMSQEEWDGMIKNPMRPLLNKAIQGEYPPASTYK
ncbi:MAG: penicillin-binding transpeptidase domain-containing protein, partial [Desulfatirhabdiaceae bacterium]